MLDPRSKTRACAQEFVNLSGERLPLTRLMNLLWAAQTWSFLLRERAIILESFHDIGGQPVIVEIEVVLRDLEPETLVDRPILNEDERTFLRAVRESYPTDIPQTGIITAKYPAPLAAYAVQREERNADARQRIASIDLDLAAFAELAARPAERAGV